MSEIVFPGVGISGYRCYGSKLINIAPLDRIGLLIGPNNVGKSSTLRFFHQQLNQVYAAIMGSQPYRFSDDADTRRVEGEKPISLMVQWPLQLSRPEETGLVQQVFDTLAVNDIAWLTFSLNGNRFNLEEKMVARLGKTLNQNELRQYLTKVISRSSGDHMTNVKDLCQYLRQSLISPPSNMIMVPAHRQVIGTDNTGSWDYSGANLIAQLDRIKDPEPQENHLNTQYRAIIKNVKEILELDQFDYRVTHESKKLLFQINEGDYRELDSLGTGYEHILLIVTATVVSPDAFISIEEPEVHVHPRLQRRLAEYLRHKATNQLLISSHSATLIDALQAATFRLAMKDHATEVTSLVDAETVELLSDLGYRASDLLQANFAVWVEGPSDRIYLRWWLQVRAPELIEGVHYVVMFYGGSLIAHVSTQDTDPAAEPSEVPIKRLNQHYAVIADSDKTSEASPLKERIQKLKQGIEATPSGHLWITDGRCIESYIAEETLEASIRKVHPSTATVPKRVDKWSNPLKALNKKEEPVKVDKIAVALDLLESEPSFENESLVKDLDQLITLIRESSA